MKIAAEIAWRFKGYELGPLNGFVQDSRLAGVVLLFAIYYRG
jgi:hypothetical protein